MDEFDKAVLEQLREPTFTPKQRGQTGGGYSLLAPSEIAGALSANIEEVLESLSVLEAIGYAKESPGVSKYPERAWFLIPR